MYILIVSHAKSLLNSKNTPVKISQPTSQQILKNLDFEVTSKPTPRKSPRLNRDVQFLYNERVQKKEALAIKPTTKSRKQDAKNTRAVAQLKKNGTSEYMNMFTIFIENSLPRSIMIGYDIATFGEIWEVHLDKMICDEIIEFKEVSNCTINLWIK